jgi:F-type H+-transporting ATPase subunit b
MLKRLLLAACLLLWVGVSRPVMAQDHTPHGDASRSPEGTEASSHVEGDERLLQIPPSRDTLLSALWVIIIFLIMLAILYPTAWKNVLAGLKAREQRIRTDIAEAEAARARAESTLKEYNTQLATAEKRVQEMITKAVAEGERLATSIKMSAQQEAEEAKERAGRDIEAAKNQAIAEIYEQTAVLATSVAEKILRRSLNADDQRDLVRRSLEQMPGIGRG